MKYLKLSAIAAVLMFYGATAVPAQASTIGELQVQLISLLQQLISLLTQQQTTGGGVPVATSTIPAPTPVPPAPTPISSSTAAYTLDDVVSVTTRAVDPIPGAIDDEYTLFTITLKNGTSRSVNVYGFSPFSMKEEAFVKSGFTGNVEKLMSLAVATLPYTDAAVIHIVSQIGHQVVADVRLARDTSGGISSVMGPVVYGSILWGDSSVAETISGLQTSGSAVKTFTLSHTYTQAGTYTITVTNGKGIKTTHEVTIK